MRVSLRDYLLAGETGGQAQNEIVLRQKRVELSRLLARYEVSLIADADTRLTVVATSEPAEPASPPTISSVPPLAPPEPPVEPRLPPAAAFVPLLLGVRMVNVASRQRTITRIAAVHAPAPLLPAAEALVLTCRNSF